MFGKKTAAVLIGLLLILAVFNMPPVSAENPSSLVSEVVVSTLSQIELRFSEEVTGVDSKSDFALKINGKEAGFSLELYYSGTVTLKLDSPLRSPHIDDIRLAVLSEDIRGKESGESVGTGIWHKAEPEPYYQKFLMSVSGVLIKAEREVLDSTMIAAGRSVDIMLYKRGDIAEALSANKASLAVVSVGNRGYHIPENRQFFDKSNDYAEGFGGIAGNNFTSCATETNINRWTKSSDPGQTSYSTLNILAHEFGHGVHNSGIDYMEDKSLSVEIRETFEASKHLWENTYAASNDQEYFATLTTIWFNSLTETKNTDGVYGPVNVRSELESFDPAGYALMEKIYPKLSMPAPWNIYSNKYDCSEGFGDPDELDCEIVPFNEEVYMTADKQDMALLKKLTAEAEELTESSGRTELSKAISQAKRVTADGFPLESDVLTAIKELEKSMSRPGSKD